MRHILLLVTFLSVAACASVPPEDQSRPLIFGYSLTPETTEPQEMSVEQGEIFFTWNAQVLATHVTVNDVKLAVVETGKGNLYCGVSQQAFYCYEDQDGDNRLERRWSTAREQRYFNILMAREPSSLVTPIPFSPYEGAPESVHERVLGLIYNGPLEGVLTDDFEFAFGLAELQLGWATSKDAPRTPDGENWQGLRTLRTINLGQMSAKVNVTPLNLTYEALKLYVEGKMDIAFQAASDGEFDLSKKFKLEVVQPPTADNEVEPLEDNEGV